MVPQIIHQIVGPEKNKIVSRCLDSWTKLSEYGFELKIWDDNALASFIAEHYGFAKEAFSNARNHGEAADIARYILVYHFGGHYFDWDIQLLRPDLFLELCEKQPKGYVLRDPKDGSLASEAFAGMKNEKFLLHLVNEIVEIYKQGRRSDLDTLYYSGPFRMRDSFRSFMHSAQVVLPIREVFLYDYHEIKDLPERDVDRPMIHYWLHSWLPKTETA